MSENFNAQPTAPKIDLMRVSDFLSRRFREATDRLPRANRSATTTNHTYRLQQEFCYRLDEIQRGPSYQAAKLVQQTNNWISNLASNP